MSLWDNVKKFAQPYTDDDYDDYDEDEEYADDDYDEPEEKPARRQAPARRSRPADHRQLQRSHAPYPRLHQQAGGGAVPSRQLQRHLQGRG